jgi:membrane protease YdiL (CAAX protease family)
MSDPELQEPAPNYAPKEWRFTILHSVGLCILFAVLQLAIALLIRQTTGLKIEELRWYHLSILNGIPGTLVLGVGAYLNNFSVHDMLLEYLPDPGWILSTVLAVLGILILASELNNILVRILPFSQDTNLIQMLLKEDFVGVIITVGIVAPIVEELMFRGIILDGLRLHNYKIGTAVITSSILFGLIHWDPINSIQTFLLGLFLCWLRISTGSLMLCVISHSVFNVAPFILIKMNAHVQGLTSLPSKTVEFQPLWLDAFGVILLLAGIAGLKFSNNEQAEQQEVHQN